MHAVAAFFAGIVTFVSGFFGSSLFASNSLVNVPTTQTASAGAAQTEIIGDPFSDLDAASPVAQPFVAASLASASPPPSHGRVLGEQTTNLAPFLSQFSTFLRAFDSYIASPLASGATAYPRYGGYLPQSDGTTALASPAITGGTISNAISGSFDALSAGTLNLSGALTGTDATFSGTLSAGTLNVAGISSGGAITGPYFTATRTTATSMFAGGITGPGNFIVQQGSGRVGIGTTSPSQLLHVSGSGLPIIKLESADPLGSEPRIDILGRDDVGASMWGFFGLKGGGGAGTTAIVSGAVTAHDYFLKTNNAIRVAIKANTGFVGIGTTTPWGKLSITGSGTGTGLAFAVADSANTPRFVIQDNGNVGLGTTSPQAKLHVSGGNARFDNLFNGAAYLQVEGISSDGRLGLKGYDTGGNGYLLRSWGGNAYSIGPGSQFTAFSLGGSIGFRAGSGVPILGGAVVGPDDFIGGTHKSLAIGTPNVHPETGYGITGIVDLATFSMSSNVLSGQRPSIRLTGDQLIFRTDTSAGSGNPGTEAMRIDSSGNVGIGTTTPGSKFVVQGLSMEHWVDASTNYRTEQITSGRIGLYGNRNDYFLVYDTQNLRVGVGATTTPWARLSVKGSGTGTGLAFAVADSTNTPRFVIQDNGRVGVGTTNPPTLFSVNGNGTNTYPISWTNNGSGFAYADSAGSGITNANPYTGGALVYLTGNNVQFYNGSSVGATITGGGVVSATSEYRLNGSSFSRVAQVNPEMVASSVVTT